MIFPYIDNNYFLPFPFLPPNCEKPPTIYSILESIVNYGKDEKTKIKDLAKEGRTTIFDFEYPLSEKVSKEDFECMILNHFLMRRIGFETVTAFKIQLNVKLNEIMPMYNKLLDSFEDFDFFDEVTKRKGFDNRTIVNNSKNTNNIKNNSQTKTNNISDRRNSELPQNRLEDLRNGSYVSNYNYDTNENSGNDSSESSGQSNTESNTNDNNNYEETISRTLANKFEIYKEFRENLKSVYGMIFDDLDCLFYQIV